MPSAHVPGRPRRGNDACRAHVMLLPTPPCQHRSPRKNFGWKMRVASRACCARSVARSLCQERRTWREQGWQLNDAAASHLHRCAALWRQGQFGLRAQANHMATLEKSAPTKHHVQRLIMLLPTAYHGCCIPLVTQRTLMSAPPERSADATSQQAALPRRKAWSPKQIQSRPFLQTSVNLHDAFIHDVLTL